MKAGDYVRTKQGRIGKISNLTVDYSSELILCEESSIPFAKHQIIKSSSNIIDLIEENDYINGLRVDKNKYGELYTSYVYYGGDIGKQCEVYTTWLKEYTEDMIESILTHEQFNSMEYKIGEISKYE